MLEIVIPEQELYNEETKEFIYTKSKTLQLEHSLVSISKWESQWLKPFLGKDEKTNEETIDYIRCMTITQNVDPDIYKNLPFKIIDTIKEYIEAPMTATWFNELKDGPKKNEIVTSEVLYYYMFVQNIPMECQKWHLNRLITLIRVCGLKNSPPKKRNRKAMLNERKALNESRKARLNTKG